MLKELFKDLDKVCTNAIENASGDNWPAGTKAKRAAVVFDKYDRKLRELTVGDVSDVHYAKMQSIYEAAAKGVKELIGEIEKGVSVEKSPDEKPKFKVGQRVQFKTWDELEEEFGKYPATGNIKTPVYAFVEKMKPLCGTYATIKTINKETVQLGEFSHKLKEFYFFTTDMIKAVE